MLKVIALTCVLLCIGCSGESGNGSSWGASASSSGPVSTAEASSSAGVGGAGGMGGAGAGSGGGPATVGGGTGIGGAGGMPLPECALPAECPVPTNKCLAPACVSGMCEVEFVPLGTPHPMQVQGDCHTLRCDGAGNAVDKVDDTDVEDDGNECTSDTCLAGMPQHYNLPAGAVCTQGGTKCDGAGACVECFAHLECLTTHSCVLGACAPLHGCSFATTSLSSSDVTVNFGGTYGNNFVPKCIKIRSGTGVNFINHGALGHPLTSGMAVAGILIPDPTGPYYPTVIVPSLYGKQLFDVGTFPFYSDLYGLQGMSGVVYVVPP